MNDFDELTRSELIAKLKDPVWRLTSGKLYKIVTKGDEDDAEQSSLVVPFIPNIAQRKFLRRMHNRNIVLKARQLGFTTLSCILWLDTALFSAEPVKCGVIAHNREAAEEIFRDKIRFAYENLPAVMHEMFPLKKATESQLVFAHNGASIRVATSMRSGTIHRLLVSEFGKICAESPKRAREIDAGSIPTVPMSGISVIESTAEGQDGSFYKKTQRAQALFEQKARLSAKDWQFHFFAWWDNPDYSIDPNGVIISPVMREYFSGVQAVIGRKLTEGQKAWYCATLESEFNGEQPIMWQEYPSTWKEAFQVSNEGCFYSAQMSRAREQGRIVERLPVVNAACSTFWDIGRGDMTTIWVMQKVGVEYRFIRYYEATGEELNHYTEWLQTLGLTFAKHYLPHEAAYKRIGETPDKNKSIKEMLESLMPGQRFEIVVRVTTLDQGIQATRGAINQSWFDETECSTGLKRLQNYKKTWDKTNGRFTSTPVHNDDSHGADGFRQFAQELEAGNTFMAGTTYERKQDKSRFVRRGSAMSI